jgi:2-keto-4-pentenoate hydratase/2-oxohepta-3-ene-1,7-dioic acid hydratase in catechol pathway
MKIICIARNYIDHAKELNNPVPDTPVLFMKPATALLKGKYFFLPEFSSDMHYECELVVRIGKVGKHISEEFALSYVDGLTVGIDFTARDLQSAQKKKGLPWEIAKAFDQSAVIGNWHAPDAVYQKENIRFSLEKNGKMVQSGQSSDMIFDMAVQIAYASRFFTLQQGDLLFTGTPVGVGAIQQGDQLQGFLNDEKVFEIGVK